MDKNGEKFLKRLNYWMHIFSSYVTCTNSPLVKLKLLKLSLLGAFAAGILRTYLVKDMLKKKEREDIEE